MRKHVAAVLSFCVLGITHAGKAAPATQPTATPVPLRDVTITDAFWSPKRQLWQRVTLNDCFDKFENSGAMANFDLVRDGKEQGVHHGEPWYDGLVYEMITASADFMVSTPDAELKRRVDGYVSRIAAAADRAPDGYLETYTTAKEPTHRWGVDGGNDRWQHDVYNAGCLAEAAVHYTRATGDTKLLRVAVRMANLMCDTMGPPPRRNIIPGHAIAELAFLELHDLFQERPELKQAVGVPVDERRYLELAQFWVDARGHHDGRADYGAYDQDHVPVSDQQTIEGHAVRATLLATGMAAIGREGGRPDYVPIALRWWRDMTERRTYLTGGVGSTAADEKFGDDYFLPNDGYAETCAAVGKAFFDQQVLRLTGEAGAADELERSLYNGALTGVALAGTSYFYENPLQADPKRNRWTWQDCPCCPPMFLKLMSAMPAYVYSTDDRGLYVNLFVGSTARATVGGQAVTITQSTEYPWAGDVSLKLEPQQPCRFRVAVRVPGWCRKDDGAPLYRSDRPAGAFGLTVNGVSEPYTLDRGYAVVDRQWRRGDTLAVTLDVSPRRVRADPAVEADRGRTALMAGPIVYCVESTDQSQPLDKLTLPADAPLRSERRPDLLGGVSVIRTEARAGDGHSAVDLTAVPFFATANRGPRTMEVWLPLAPVQRAQADGASLMLAGPPDAP